jgi:hypothetical protein
MNLPYLHRDRTCRRRRFGKQPLRRRFRHDSVAGLEHGRLQLRRQLEPDVRSASFQRDRPMLANLNGGGLKRPLVIVSDEHVDEALWSAYHRYNKSAVTKELLQRYLQPQHRHRARLRKLSHG